MKISQAMRGWLVALWWGSVGLCVLICGLSLLSLHCYMSWVDADSTHTVLLYSGIAEIMWYVPNPHSDRPFVSDFDAPGLHCERNLYRWCVLLSWPTSIQVSTDACAFTCYTVPVLWPSLVGLAFAYGMYIARKLHMARKYGRDAGRLRPVHEKRDEG